MSVTKVVSDHFSLQILSWYLLSSPIRHFRNEKVTGAEMRSAIILSIVTRDSLVSYWPIFFLSLVTDHKSLRKLTQPSSLSFLKWPIRKRELFSVPTVALGGATRKRARQTVYYNTSSPFLFDKFLIELLWRIC